MNAISMLLLFFIAHLSETLAISSYEIFSWCRNILPKHMPYACLRLQTRTRQALKLPCSECTMNLGGMRWVGQTATVRSLWTYQGGTMDLPWVILLRIRIANVPEKKIHHSTFEVQILVQSGDLYWRESRQILEHSKSDRLPIAIRNQPFFLLTLLDSLNAWRKHDHISN